MFSFIFLLLIKTSKQDDYFENEKIYDLFPIHRSNSTYIFPYNLNKICQIKIVNNYVVGNIEDPYSFIRSGNSFLLNLTRNNNVSILNCLNFKGYSYVIYKYTKDQNIIHILKNRIERSFNIRIKIKSLHFDHFNSNLIAISTSNCLFSLNLDELDQNDVWNIENYFYSPLKHLNFSELDIYVPNHKDFMTFNSTYYYISDPENFVYKISKSSSSLNINRLITLENPYHSPKFLNIHFPKFKTLFPQTISNPDIVAISYNNPFIIHFPNPPKIQDMPNGSNYLINMLVYIFVISIFLIIIRFLFVKMHKFAKTHPLGAKKRQEIKDEDEILGKELNRVCFKPLDF